jgi:hypothetical protein
LNKEQQQMTELELKVLADELGVALTDKIINLAIHCYSKGFKDGSTQQKQAQVMSEALNKLSK